MTWLESIGAQHGHSEEEYLDELLILCGSKMCGFALMSPGVTADGGSYTIK